jgi:hypothetical protein
MYCTVRSSEKRLTRVPSMGVASASPVSGFTRVAPTALQPMAGFASVQSSSVLSCRSTLKRLNDGATPTKNQSLSLRMGPPSSAPKSPRFQARPLALMTEPACWTSVPAVWRKPGATLAKTEPWNSLEPDLVTTLRMPPVERPYSGR